MGKSVLDTFKETFHICDLADLYGMQIDSKESSPLWPKYVHGADKVLVNKPKNIFQVVNGSDGGGKYKGVLDFFIEFDPSGLAGGNWDRIRKEAGRMLNLPESDFKPKSPAVYRREAKSLEFNDSARANIVKYHQKSTSALSEHSYLSDRRHISPTLLKQSRFNNCLRMATGYDFFKNAMFYHRDKDGFCAYENHNHTLNGNLNLISKGSRKCLWYTDDIFDKKTEGVFIGEAAIDALSFATLTEKTKPNIALLTFGGQFSGRVYNDDEKKELNKDSHVIEALLPIFEKSTASTIYISNDNDHAGQGYDEFFNEFFETYFPGKFNLYINKPPHALNDWNDFLTASKHNAKTGFIPLAKKTNNLILAEGGIGSFRIFPSERVEGTTVMCLPPSGHMTGEMGAIAKSYIHAMKENNPNALLTYTSIDDKFTYVKRIERWRREHLPDLEYVAKKNFCPIQSLLNDNRLTDKSTLKSWSGYRENTVHPHKLASKTNTIVLTCNNEKNTRYFNSNCDPVKMIISIPSKAERDGNKYALNEVKKFLTQVFKTSEFNDITVRFSPCSQNNKDYNFNHCAFLNEALDNIGKSFDSYEDKIKVPAQERINSLEIIKDKPQEGFDNILNCLATKGLVKSGNLESITPRELKHSQKKRPSVPPKHLRTENTPSRTPGY